MRRLPILPSLPFPGICLPCLAGHLTLLSLLRVRRHGNSGVTGPGWA